MLKQDSRMTYDKSVDIWTIGILTFEMLYGDPPFYHEDMSVSYRRILQAQVSFPSAPHTSSDAKVGSKATAKQGRKEGRDWHGVARRLLRFLFPLLTTSYFRISSAAYFAKRRASA